MKRQEHLAEVEEVAIRVRVENLKNGRYLGTSPDVPGLVAGGRSVAETVEIAQGLARKIVESCLEQDDPLPPCSGARFGRSANSAFLFLSLKWDASQDFPGKLPTVSERLVSNSTFPVPAATKSGPSPNGEKGHASAPFRRHGRGHAARFSEKLELT
jgi:antitoxin HicB